VFYTSWARWGVNVSPRPVLHNISYGSSPTHYALQDFRPFLSSFFQGQVSLHLLTWPNFQPGVSVEGCCGRSVPNAVAGENQRKDGRHARS